MLDRRLACARLIAASFALAACSTPSASVDGGGPYLVLAIDTARLRDQQLQNVADQMMAELREANPAILYSRRDVVGEAARVQPTDRADLQRALATLRSLATDPETNEDTLTFSVTDDGVIEARLTPSRLRALSYQAAQQSVEVIRRRIDPTGTGDIEIEQQGDQRIFVRAPPNTDPTELRRRIGITGLLTFHIVRDVSQEDIAAGRMPPGTTLAQPYPGIGEAAEVVDRRPRFTGERLVRATPSTDPATEQFVVSFQLDSEGTRVFCRITRDYTGQRFAVLLDNQVLTAPRINEPICGGSGQISGDFTADSATDLAMILSAGAFPAPLIIIEEGVTPGRR